MKFLLLNEVLNFFELLIKKVGFILLTLSKFQIIKANVWLIYFKSFEFMVYSFNFAFEKLNFLNFEALLNFSLAKSAQNLNS